MMNGSVDVSVDGSMAGLINDDVDRILFGGGGSTDHSDDIFHRGNDSVEEEETAPEKQ
jgi:hypothetical protein